MKHIIHRNITIIKLVALTLVTIGLIVLAYYFNFLETLGNYSIAAIGILAYCGAFTYIGIEDALYYIRKYTYKKYIDKTVDVKFTIYNVEKLVETYIKRYNVAGGYFNYKNDLFFFLRDEGHNPITVKINPITNGVTLVDDYGMEFTKAYANSNPENFSIVVRLPLNLSDKEYINLNNIRLKIVK